MSSIGGDLIREARRRAGLTQAELADRARTSQPGIARWESGRTAVSLDDVLRLVRMCGLDLELVLLPRDDSDMAQAARLVDLTGQERMDRHARLLRQLNAVREPAGAEMELDLARLLEVLERHEVAYVLIGGLAAVYHGSPFPTKDADITPRADRSNLARLSSGA